VESSCERSNELSGCIKRWENTSYYTIAGLSISAQVHRVSLLVN
jgi:hypothetical protein